MFGQAIRNRFIARLIALQFETNFPPRARVTRSRYEAPRVAIG